MGRPRGYRGFTVEEIDSINRDLRICIEKNNPCKRVGIEDIAADLGLSRMTVYRRAEKAGYRLVFQFVLI